MPESARTCLGCRNRRPRGELIRIVRGPGGAAGFDLEARLPGRGAWVCPSPACVDALVPGPISHVLHGPTTLPAIALRREVLAEAFGRRVTNLLTMARKIRGVTFGPAGARTTLAEGRVELLFLAGDLPADTLASWRARASGSPVRLVASSAVLGRLAGRGPVDVAAVTARGIATSLLIAFDRWRAFCTISCDNEISADLRQGGRQRTVLPPKEAGGR